MVLFPFKSEGLTTNRADGICTFQSEYKSLRIRRTNDVSSCTSPSLKAREDPCPGSRAESRKREFSPFPYFLFSSGLHGMD